MDGDALSLIAQGGPWSVAAGAMGIAWRMFILYSTSQEKRIEEAGGYKVALLDVTNKLATLGEVLKAQGSNK
jgi:hypothetical protein